MHDRVQEVNTWEEVFNALTIDIALWCRVEMCKCQVRDRWKISPRCLWEVVSFSAWLQNRSGEWRDGLFVMVRTSVFSALNVTLHKSDHISNWRRSLDNIVCKALGFLEEHKTIVSSANREIEDLMFVPMSLTYLRKSKGPSTYPWGTPHFVYKCSERKSPKRTNCDLDRTAASYKQNQSRRADAIWKGRNEWLCQKL